MVGKIAYKKSKGSIHNLSGAPGKDQEKLQIVSRIFFA